MAFPAYTSLIDQTIRTVQHLNGVVATYVFTGWFGQLLTSTSRTTTSSLLSAAGTAGSTYTPVSQDEKWVLDDISTAYGLSSS